MDQFVQLDDVALRADDTSDIDLDTEVQSVLNRSSRSRSGSVTPVLSGPRLGAPAADALPLSNRENFQRRLCESIVFTLQAASRCSGDERAMLLQELVADLSTQVEPRVLGYFLADGSITPQQRFGSRHYYHLAGVGFADMRNLYNDLDVEQLVSALRSAPLFNVVYALLFHQVTSVSVLLLTFG